MWSNKKNSNNLKSLTATEYLHAIKIRWGWHLLQSCYQINYHRLMQKRILRRVWFCFLTIYWSLPNYWLFHVDLVLLMAAFTISCAPPKTLKRSLKTARDCLFMDFFVNKGSKIDCFINILTYKTIWKVC